MKPGSRAFVLAAGLGTRMQPLTLTLPKPLVKVAGQPLIAYAFDKLRAANVEEAIVNVHHLSEQIEAWCQTVATPKIIISDERQTLLDTGGGVAAALPHLGQDPFFVLNSDSFWIDGEIPALTRLRSAWLDEEMDCLLLLCDPAHTTGYSGRGDFVMDGSGRLARARLQPHAKALAFIGGYMVHPRLFSTAPKGAFSMNVMWDEAITRGRLHGLVHDGHWLHVGTVESIALAEQWLARSRGHQT